jgi:tetratricopeptide (TPR) repeat protein
MLLMEKKDQLADKFDRNNFDWKSEVKKNYTLLSAFRHIVTAMNDSKETGNEHFKKSEFEEAITYYKQSLRLAKQKEDDD